MAEPSTKLKPYKLPSSAELWNGALCGADGGLIAGLVSSGLIGIVLVIDSGIRAYGTPGTIGATSFWMVVWLSCWLIPAAGLGGMILGSIVGFLAGGLIHLVLTPLLPDALWPALAQPLRRGMLIGSLVGTIIESGLVVIASVYNGMSLPPVLADPSLASLFIVLLPMFGFLFGGFVNPFRVVVLPYLLNAEIEV